MNINVQELFKEELRDLAIEDDGCITYVGYTYEEAEDVAYMIVSDQEDRAGDFYREDQYEKLVSIVYDYLSQAIIARLSPKS